MSNFCYYGDAKGVSSYSVKICECICFHLVHLCLEISNGALMVLKRDRLRNLSNTSSFQSAFELISQNETKTCKVKLILRLKRLACQLLDCKS